MLPKRGRGRPRKLTGSLNCSTKLVVENGEAFENNSNEVKEEICDEAFENNEDETKGLVEEGQYQHNAKKIKLQCKKCGKTFVFKKCFIKHMKNEHSETPGSVSCDMCEVTCPNKQILIKHINTKHDPKSYACKYCGKKFVRKAHIKRHLLQKGCDGRDLSKISCHICNAEFGRKDNLMTHLRQQHITSKSFFCKKCNYVTKNYSKLIVHTRNFHDPKPLRYECDHCGRLTNCRAAMVKHLEIHGEKKYMCGVCNYRTFTVEVMRRHALTHVEDKPFKCDLCDRSFIQKGLLVRHLEKHSSYTCRICDIQFRSRNELINHENSHDGVTLQCTYEDCGKTGFKNSFQLDRHIEEHMNEFKCEICSKMFKNEATMRRHVTTHMLDRPRRCMYCVCARAYLRGEQLLRHVRKHHADVFKQRLLHVRKVLGSYATHDRVRKSELDAILNVLDAESERIVKDFGTGVLYGGLQEVNENEIIEELPKLEPSPLLSEEELAENLKEMLSKLVDNELLEAFGWPHDAVDEILEKVLENCSVRIADREKWSRVQRLRENAKYLFLYVIEDKNIARMLDTHTIDQVITHILGQVSEEN